MDSGLVDNSTHKISSITSMSSESSESSESSKSAKIANIRFEKAEIQAIAGLSGIFSLRMLGLFMILPVFAIYAKQLSGVSAAGMGLALGIYGLTQALCQVPFGYLSDRFGRKPMIIIGLLLFCLGSVVAAMSDSIQGVIIGRSLQGAGAVGSVIMALVADLTREEVRLRAMATIGITIGFSFGLSFILGPLLSSSFGVRGIFWLTAALALAGILLLQYFVPTPVRRETSAVQGFPVTFINNKLCSLYFGVLVLHASLTALFIKIPLQLQAMQFTEAETWQFYLPVFLISVILTIPVILFMERNKQFKASVLALAALLLLSEILLATLHNSTIQLGVSLCLFFVAFNSLEACLPATISKAAPPEQKGMALGVFGTLQFLGLFLGGLCAGLLDALNPNFAVLGFCVILALTWLLWIFNTTER
jgi:MFS family permease